jgi:DNA-binding MarR family transcriptional regulator
MPEKSLRARTGELWRTHNPALDTSPMLVVSQVKRISALLVRAVDDIYVDAGTSATEVELLIPLRYADPPLTAIRLAEHLGMSRAGVSKTLANLERRGLISRTRNPADRRSALLELTPTGARLIDEVFPRELAAQAELLADLDGDRVSVLRALERLAEVLEHPRGRQL